MFKTKSTVELRGVDFAFRLARSAGFVKVRKGAVSATKRGSQLGRDPVADWRAAFHGLVDLGVLRFQYANATWIDPYWKELVDAEQLRRHRELLDRDVRDICRTFADLGAVDVTDVQTVTTIYGHTQEHGGRVALTSLGASAVHPLTRSAADLGSLEPRGTG